MEEVFDIARGDLVALPDGATAVVRYVALTGTFRSGQPRCWQLTIGLEEDVSRETSPRRLTAPGG